MLVVTDTLKIPKDEIQFTFSRSAGPGGQNVNKVNTKATLRWDVRSSPSLSEEVRQRFLAKYPRRVNKEGQLVLSSQRFRDQQRNLADCLEKLRQLLLAVEKPPRRRKKTSPTKASRRRRLAEKQANSEKKQRRQPVERNEA
jgi:ribosome-associated protein